MSLVQRVKHRSAPLDAQENIENGNVAFCLGTFGWGFRIVFGQQPGPLPIVAHSSATFPLLGR